MSLILKYITKIDKPNADSHPDKQIIIKANKTPRLLYKSNQNLNLF